MILAKEKKEEFKKASEPLIKWLNERGHPHVTAIVTPTNAEFLGGSCNHVTYEFVKD